MQALSTYRTNRTKDKRWYVGVVCEYCRSPILFGLDRSEGYGPLGKCLRLVLTCVGPQCARQADYSGAPVLRYQKGDDPSAPVMRASRA